MNYEYYMVQVPPTIQVKQKEFVGNEAAYFLQTTANQYAAQGWEFYRVDSIGVSVQPGCLGIIMGHKQELLSYYVLTFRRQK